MLASVYSFIDGKRPLIEGLSFNKVSHCIVKACQVAYIPSDTGVPPALCFFVDYQCAFVERFRLLVFSQGMIKLCQVSQPDRNPGVVGTINRFTNRKRPL